MQILCILQDRCGELREVLDATTGIMNFIQKFWQGFYPLFLLEMTDIANSPEGDEQDSKEAEVR